MASKGSRRIEKKRDPRSGAKYYYGTELAHGKERFIATVVRNGRRWRWRSFVKSELEDKVADKLAELAREGVEAVALSRDQRHDAAKAAKLLLDGESLEDAAELLSACRHLLGVVDAEGVPVGDWTPSDIREAIKEAVEEVVEARDVLGGRASIKSVADYWLVRNPDRSAVTMETALAEFKAEVEGRCVRSYVQHLKAHLEAFTRWLGRNALKKGRRKKDELDAAKVPDIELKEGGKRAVVGIEVAEMEAFLADHRKRSERGELATQGESGAKRPRPVPFSDATWNKWVVSFKHFFGWARRRYDLPFDPAERLEKKRLPRGTDEAAFLSAGNVEKLLRAAERTSPEWVPTVAIAFFAGLRPVELVGKYEGEGKPVLGLAWEHTDIDGQLVVRGETTKTRQRRTVALSDNLRAWLKAYGPSERKGPVVRNPTAWRKAKARIVREARVAWPQDIARHTYATMHFGLYGDRARLEAAMGHGQGSGVLEANYKSAVTRSEARKFWSIMPSRKGGRNGR